MTLPHDRIDMDGFEESLRQLVPAVPDHLMAETFFLAGQASVQGCEKTSRSIGALSAFSRGLITGLAAAVLVVVGSLSLGLELRYPGSKSGAEMTSNQAIPDQLSVPNRNVIPEQIVGPSVFVEAPDANSVAQPVPESFRANRYATASGEASASASPFFALAWSPFQASLLQKQVASPIVVPERLLDVYASLRDPVQVRAMQTDRTLERQVESMPSLFPVRVFTSREAFSGWEF